MDPSFVEDFQDFIVSPEDFEIIDTIGKGGYGTVFSAKEKKTGRLYAIKELTLTHSTSFLYYCREVEILSKVRTKFLLSLRGFTATPPYWIVTPLAPNGSLFSALRSRELTATDKTIIALCIAHGMRTLHTHSIIHRDLKSLNVLMDESWLPLICDFGTSRFADNSMTLQLGTPQYQAPETYQSKAYTERVDVYSYALLLLELQTGRLPFPGMNNVQIMMATVERNFRPKLPPELPERLKLLIDLCWNENPKERPSFDQIFQLFKAGRVYYDGCDLAKVTQFLVDEELI